MPRRKKTPGPGRPQLPPEDVRGTQILSKVTPAEARAIRESARGEGLTVSAWVRKVLVASTLPRNP